MTRRVSISAQFAPNFPSFSLLARPVIGRGRNTASASLPSASAVTGRDIVRSAWVSNYVPVPFVKALIF